uniref:RxLR effector candidate protein n=1 Tax=Hyaloperonospora arabidopsidis (strain Emoy2) TaxID=559515 RepID=M4BUY6_HYAAE
MGMLVVLVLWWLLYMARQGKRLSRLWARESSRAAGDTVKYEIGPVALTWCL